MRPTSRILAGKARGTYEAWKNLRLNPRLSYVCDETNAVMSIDLGSSNLSGTLPEDLGSLTHLQWLNFNNNSLLEGPLPINLQVLGCLAGADFAKTGMYCSSNGALKDEKAGEECPALLSTKPFSKNLTEGTIDSLCPMPFFLGFAKEGTDSEIWDEPVEEPNRCNETKSRIRCRNVVQNVPLASTCLPVRAFSTAQRVALQEEDPRGPVKGQEYVQNLLNFTSLTLPQIFRDENVEMSLHRGVVKLDPQYFNYQGCKCVDNNMESKTEPAPQPPKSPVLPSNWTGSNSATRGDEEDDEGSVGGLLRWLVPQLSSSDGAESIEPELELLLRCEEKSNDRLAVLIGISVAGFISAVLSLFLSVFIFTHRNEIAFGILRRQRRYAKARSMPGFSTSRKLNRYLESLFEQEDRGAAVTASAAQSQAGALPVVVVSCALICPPDLREAPEWDLAVAAFTRVCRKNTENFCGAEHVDEGQRASVFTGVFHEPGDAVQFALSTQFRLLRYPWPGKATRAPHTYQLALCPDLGYEHDGRRLVFCGPACSMGIAMGEVTGVARGYGSFRGRQRSRLSNLYGEYREEPFGPIARAELLAGSSPDGRVLIQSDVYAYVSGDLLDVSKRVESSLHSSIFERSQRFGRKALQAVSSMFSCRGKSSKILPERPSVLADASGANPREARPSKSPQVRVISTVEQAGDALWCYPVVLAVGRYRLVSDGMRRSLKSGPVASLPNTSIGYSTPSPSHGYYRTQLSKAATHATWVDQAGGGSCCAEIDLFELVPRCLLERVIRRRQQQLAGEQVTPGFLDAPGALESLQSEMAPPPPPQGSSTLQSSMSRPLMPEITMAFVAGEKLDDLSIVDDALYDAALDCYNCCVQLAVSATGGYVCQELGGTFMLVFASPAAALEFALLLQYVLMEAAWDESLLELKSAGTVTDGSQLLFRGVRARCGIFKGTPSCVVPHRTTGRADVFGTIVNRAARFQSSAYGGQILVSDDVHRDAREAWNAGARGGGDQPVAERVVIRDIGRFRFKGVETSYRIIEMIPAALQARQRHVPGRPPAGKSIMVRSGKGQIGESLVHLPDARALVARHQVGMPPLDRPDSLTRRMSLFLQ